MLWGGKCLSNKDRKCFPTFVTTFALYGGLNHIIFLFQFLLVVVFCLMFYWYRIWCLYLPFVSASLHGVNEFLSISLFDDNCGNLDSIDFGSCWSRILTVDDWILCWHELLYCWLLGKEGMLSFQNSKWHLGNSRLSCCIEL